MYQRLDREMPGAVMLTRNRKTVPGIVATNISNGKGRSTLHSCQTGVSMSWKFHRMVRISWRQCPLTLMSDPLISSKTKGPGEQGAPRNHPEISSQKVADFKCWFPMTPMETFLGEGFWGISGGPFFSRPRRLRSLRSLSLSGWKLKATSKAQGLGRGLCYVVAPSPCKPSPCLLCSLLLSALFCCSLLLSAHLLSRLALSLYIYIYHWGKTITYLIFTPDELF